MTTTAQSPDVALNKFLAGLSTARTGMVGRKPGDIASQGYLGSRNDFKSKPLVSMNLDGPIVSSEPILVEIDPGNSKADSNLSSDDHCAARAQAIRETVASAGIACATMTIATSLGLISIASAAFYALGYVIASGISIRCLRRIELT